MGIVPSALRHSPHRSGAGARSRIQPGGWRRLEPGWHPRGCGGRHLATPPWMVNRPGAGARSKRGGAYGPGDRALGHPLPAVAGTWRVSPDGEGHSSEARWWLRPWRSTRPLSATQRWCSGQHVGLSSRRPGFEPPSLYSLRAGCLVPWPVGGDGGTRHPLKVEIAGSSPARVTNPMRCESHTPGCYPGEGGALPPVGAMPGCLSGKGCACKAHVRRFEPGSRLDLGVSPRSMWA